MFFLLSACSNSNKTKESEQDDEVGEPIVETMSQSNHKEIHMINNVAVGMAFSDLVHLIPDYATIELKEFNLRDYHFRFEGQQWTFNEDGILSFILAYGNGISLDDKVKVGDYSDAILANVGEPSIKKDDFFSYDYGSYELQFYLSNDNVEDIRMILRTALEGSVSDKQLLSKYYKQYLVSNSVSISEKEKEPLSKEISDVISEEVSEKEMASVQSENDITEETSDSANAYSPNESTKDAGENSNTVQQNGKSFTREELIDIAIEVEQTFTLYQQTVYGNHEQSITEKRDILQKTYKQNDFWNKGLELEESVLNIEERDMDIYEFVMKYMDAVDSACSFQIVAYNMMVSGDGSEEEIQAIEKLAREESGRAIEVYEQGKRNVKIY